MAWAENENDTQHVCASTDMSYVAESSPPGGGEHSPVIPPAYPCPRPRESVMIKLREPITTVDQCQEILIPFDYET
jgi:hypothetical protein